MTLRAPAALLAALATFLGVQIPARAEPPSPAASAVIDEVGALDPEQRSALIAATQALLVECDLGAAVLFAPPVDASALPRCAAGARTDLVRRGLLPRRSALFLFADGDLRISDRPASFDRRLAPDAVTAAWKGTQEVSPFPLRVERFLRALAGSCTGKIPPGTDDPPADEPDDPPPEPPPVPDPPPPGAPPRLAKTGEFRLLVNLAWLQDGQPNSDFVALDSRDRTEFDEPPRLDWSGNSFEAFAFQTRPGPALDTDSRGRNLYSQWTHRVRLFGAISDDEQTLLSLTVVWVSRCVRPGGRLFEYEEWTAAFTNVPLDSVTPPPSGSNPLAGGSTPGVVRVFRISDPDKPSLDHVLQIERRRGYPDTPSTASRVSHALASEVGLSFSVG
jgi:hypothetical protein